MTVISFHISQIQTDSSQKIVILRNIFLGFKKWKKKTSIISKENVFRNFMEINCSYWMIQKTVFFSVCWGTFIVFGKNQKHLKELTISFLKDASHAWHHNFKMRRSIYKWNAQTPVKCSRKKFQLFRTPTTSIDMQRPPLSSADVRHLW